MILKWDPGRRIARGGFGLKLASDSEFTILDVPNPASMQLSDGSILTIYYQKDEPDEKPCLMGTHWRLPRPP